MASAYLEHLLLIEGEDMQGLRLRVVLSHILLASLSGHELNGFEHYIV